MRNCYTFLISISVLAVINTGCSSDQSGPALFTRLSPESTGVTFTNEITTSDTLNNLNYPFTYHGGGVAIGDINNDGLPDLYFTANMQTSRLYLNKGEMKFEDITESAGVETNRGASGAAMADINGDGYLDIYVSTVSSNDAPEEARTNLLFINNGDNTFAEAAAQYNLNSTSYTTHSAFLDYDRDGDLDLYLLNHHPGLFARNNAVRPASSTPFGQQSTSYDELYRNEGNGTFTKVGEEAGIVQQTGFGLGVAVSDINRDGWPDIYVSNDVVTNDVLYINNKDGTFSDKTAESLKHSSFAGMGVDIADFNNDGWPDIYQTEMMPNSLRMKKIMSGGISYEHYKEMRAKGYLHQYPLNTLQLSNGVDVNGDIIFSEIARMANVSYTHWSWSTLFGDYDNDGLKDIMVTNGFPKAINNYDFLTEINQLGRFGTNETRQQKRQKIMENLHGYEVPNYIFRNQGDLTFEDKSQDWNFDDAGYSYGASQADLDNDGDLDIVINNLNTPASIYQNQADTLTDNHYLSVKLLGSPMNTNGIGTKVVVKTGNDTQHQYFSPYRGYQSSLDKRMLFGLGNHETIDSLKVIWPDQHQQILTNLETDRQIELNYNEAKSSMPAEASDKENQIFTDITEELDIEYSHQENEYNDYDRQGLLPYQLSKLGPPLAVADVNGDGREDFFVGGAAGQEGSLFIQTDDGSFQKSEKQPWTTDNDYEDVGATFFDADGDGDLDLYVASGGYEFSPASEMLQDRLYLNDGSGNFVRNRSALPQMLTSSSCVRPGDYDNDGDMDLFICGRVVPRQYPYPAKSYILRNDNGSFADVTSEIAPGLVEPGLITDAQWSDFNNDDQPDLVTVGEWMPVQFFRNQENTFENVTGQLGMQNKTGWWYSLEKGDFDNDGDTDFVAGNLGQNYSYVASEEKPFHIFAHDFDSNQSVDLILAFEKDGTLYPYYGKAKLSMEIPPINELYQSYETFANARVEKVIGSGGIEEALNLKANTFASIYIENKGDEGFSATPLPNEAQISSINDIISLNADGDGNKDLLIAGNLYNVEPQTARNDAGNGLLLKGNGEGDFEPVSPFKSGFLAPLMVTDLEIIETARGKMVIVVNNDNEIQVFKIN